MATGQMHKLNFPQNIVIVSIAALVSFNVTARDLLPSITNRAERAVEVRPADIPSDEELERAGALVGEVVIDNQDIFATDTPEEDATLFRLANYLHVKTKHPAIEQQLLFVPGEKYSRQKIEESERLLRSQRYLVDVHIYPYAYSNGRVDIKVRTRDVWTFQPGISYGRTGGVNTTGVKIEEANLFGYGKSLALTYNTSVDRKTTVLDYRDAQLFGSRWSLGVQLADNSDGHKNALQVERPFYSLDTRWSAGARVLSERRIDGVYDLGEIIDRYRIAQRSATMFYGWSDGLNDHLVSRWTAGFSYDDKQFSPLVAPAGSGFAPASRKLAYPWLNYELIEDRYRKVENLNQIGRAEDIRLGWRANAFVGTALPSLGADRYALITGASASRNIMPGDKEIIELNAGLSGRVENSQWQNAVMNFSSRYYWRHSPHRLTYLSAQVDTGTRLNIDQRLILGGDNGLRGYPLRYQSGSGRWILTAEQRLFSDWYPFRLTRVGGAIFFDAGRTWGDNTLPSGLQGTRSLGILRDVGFGFRLGQVRSGLGNVIHVDVAFPLDGRGDVSKAQLLVQTKSSF